MELITIPVGFLQENVYIYFDEATMEGVIIDPGDNSGDIISVLKSKAIDIKAILLTHGHHDHIGACSEVRAFTNAPVCAGKNEANLLGDADLNCSGKLSRRKNEIQPDKVFEDGEEFELGKNKLKVIFTPGHTSGSVCYYDEANKALFSGDTLFFCSIGRTDFATGNYNEMMDSLNKLLKLPKDVTVYPGHDKKTSIGFETDNNPYVD